MLPPDWWYYLNQHGESKNVDFPIKIKPVIGWSPRKYVFDWKKTVPGPRFPVEELIVSFPRLPCNVNNLSEYIITKLLLLLSIATKN
jgi:hypothetical protein